jgi:hypothetical protein
MNFKIKVDYNQDLSISQRPYIFFLPFSWSGKEGEVQQLAYWASKIIDTCNPGSHGLIYGKLFAAGLATNLIYRFTIGSLLKICNGLGVLDPCY